VIRGALETADRTGGICARLPLATLTLVAPTVVVGRIYVGSFFGRLYAFGEG
jgi:hypothetical protein